MDTGGLLYRLALSKYIQPLCWVVKITYQHDDQEFADVETFDDGAHSRISDKLTNKEEGTSYLSSNYFFIYHFIFQLYCASITFLLRDAIFIGQAYCLCFSGFAKGCPKSTNAWPFVGHQVFALHVDCSPCMILIIIINSNNSDTCCRG